MISSLILPGWYTHDVLFFSSIFTQRANWRLSYAALLRARNSFTMASSLSALNMKASSSYKIQVVIKDFEYFIEVEDNA